MNDNLLNFLGIARRAGKIKLGADPVIDSIKSKKAKLIVFSSDISDKTRKNIKFTADTYAVECITVNRTKEEINFALGKYSAVISVEDSGFSNKIKDMIMKQM